MLYVVCFPMQDSLLKQKHPIKGKKKLLLSHLFYPVMSLLHHWRVEEDQSDYRII